MMVYAIIGWIVVAGFSFGFAWFASELIKEILNGYPWGMRLVIAIIMIVISLGLIYTLYTYAPFKIVGLL